MLEWLNKHKAKFLTTAAVAVITSGVGFLYTWAGAADDRLDELEQGQRAVFAVTSRSASTDRSQWEKIASNSTAASKNLGRMEALLHIVGGNHDELDKLRRVVGLMELIDNSEVTVEQVEGAIRLLDRIRSFLPTGPEKPAVKPVLPLPPAPVQQQRPIVPKPLTKVELDEYMKNEKGRTPKK